MTDSRPQHFPVSQWSWSYMSGAWLQERLVAWIGQQTRRGALAQHHRCTGRRCVHQATGRPWLAPCWWGGATSGPTLPWNLPGRTAEGPVCLYLQTPKASVPPFAKHNQHGCRKLLVTGTQTEGHSSLRVRSVSHTKRGEETPWGNCSPDSSKGETSLVWMWAGAGTEIGGATAHRINQSLIPSRARIAEPAFFTLRVGGLWDAVVKPQLPYCLCSTTLDMCLKECVHYRDTCTPRCSQQPHCRGSLSRDECWRFTNMPSFA
jgi:hypothetical protein